MNNATNRKMSFLVYLDSYPAVISLPPEQRGFLFSALMVYAARVSQIPDLELEEILEQFPQLSPEGQMAFQFMAAHIQRDTQKWLQQQSYRQQQRQKHQEEVKDIDEGLASWLYSPEK